MRQINLALAFAFFTVGCANQSPARLAVYVHPEQFLNQPVQVCGYMIDSSNIVESADRDDAERRGGLSIADKGPLDLRHRGPVCVEGRVVYLGCATGEAVCFDIAFDYGLRISRVIRAQDVAVNQGHPGQSNGTNAVVDPPRLELERSIADERPDPRADQRPVPERQAAVRTDEFTTAGRYRYIDGDRLIRPCASGQVCEETLVRDARLQREVERSADFEATLRVRRIAACGSRSSQVACVTSEDGTALEIVRWLEVRRPPANEPRFRHSTSAAPPTDGLALRVSAGTCGQTTIAALGADPRPYAGRRVCVSGFFGRMVPYGETAAELFATREQAETLHADHYLDLGVRLDAETQERLSRYSAQPAQVDGIFEYDPRCWPEGGQREPAYNCYPARPMRILRPDLHFADGTQVPFGTVPALTSAAAPRPRRAPERPTVQSSAAPQSSLQTGEGRAFHVASGMERSCDVTDLSTVFQNPLRYDAKTFCGDVIAYPEGLTIKMFPTSHRPEDVRNDLVLLPELESEELLRRSNPSRPFIAHVRGRLEPMRECFERARPAGHMCIPYRRPIVIHLTQVLEQPRTAASAVAAQPPAPERAYRPAEIVRNIRSLDGRQVRIAGYLRLGQEARALWQSRQDFEDARARGASGGDPIWDRCITAYYDLAIAREVERAAGSVIDAVGTIGVNRDQGEGVDLWSCNDVYVTIHRIGPGDAGRGRANGVPDDRSTLVVDRGRRAARERAGPR